MEDKSSDGRSQLVTLFTSGISSREEKYICLSPTNLDPEHKVVPATLIDDYRLRCPKYDPLQWRCLYHVHFRTNFSLRSIGPEATFGSSCLSIHLVFDHLFGPQATFQEERALPILWTRQCSRLPALTIDEGWPAALRTDPSKECSNTIRSCPASMQKRQGRRTNTTRRTKRARTPVSASSQHRNASRSMTLT